MFRAEQIDGRSFPKGTFCLTYDDGPGETDIPGPGPRTLDIAEYLADESIRATFFVVGKHAEEHPRILPQIVELGHIVGNHTYDHATWADAFKATKPPPVEQVVKAESIIRKQTGLRTMCFRPPGGCWSPQAAQALNLNGDISAKHAGSFSWNIDKADYEFWKRGESPEHCANAYFGRIEEEGRGIILMHDGSADGDGSEKLNRALELTRLLVPMLRKHGYDLIALDSIPEVRASVEA